MKLLKILLAWTSTYLLVFSSLELTACGSKSNETPQTTQEAAQAPAGDASQGSAELPAVNLTADGLDELLAPIALYPDPVLAVMLQAAVNPQEVMDGGNWLAVDQNHNLKEAALDEASSKSGFTPVMQALLHYPTVVDLMCTEFDWTKQLGAAYQANPKAVLASVQRLRAQAVDTGALKSSPQMQVNVTQDQGQQVVELKPGDPKVVYVPQYDPAQVYGTTTTTTSNGGTTTTTTTTTGAGTSTTNVNNTTVVQEKSGVSTGTAVLIGLLSFGAGIAVGAAINNNNYYYPAWGYGGVWYGPRPYYPPPYHPVYYPGWGGGYHYNRPVYVQNNIYINNNNNYYNRFNNNGNMQPNYKPRPVPYNNNPNGTLANNMGNRPANKNGVNYQPKPGTRPAGGGNASTMQRPGQGNTPGNVQRPASADNKANNWKGQSTYQGNKNVQSRPSATPGNANAGNMNRGPAGQPGRTPSASTGDRGFPTTGGTRPSTGNMQSRPTTGSTPGGRPNTDNMQTRPSGGNTPTTRPSTQQPATRPAAQPASRPQPSTGGAFNGASNPKADRAASNRGKASMGASTAARPTTGGRKR